MGESIGPYMVSAAPWWMLASLVLTLAALHLVFRDRLALAGGALSVSLLGMVVHRHLARLVVLDGAVDPGGMIVRPQWGVFGLFLACFVVMLVAVAWMLRVFLGSPPADATA